MQNSQERKALIFAFASGLFFGLANTANAAVGKRVGYHWIYCVFVSPVLVAIIFHVGNWIKSNKLREKMGSPTLSFFDRSTSVYWLQDEDQKFKVNWTSVWVPIRRAAMQLWIFVWLNTTFQFASNAGLNPGVISTLFTTSLIWVAVFFFFKHGQKLRLLDLVGMGFMVIAVCLISLSKQILSETLAEVTEEQFTFQIVAIVAGFIVGFTFCLNSIEMFYSVTKTQVRPIQANVDGSLLISLVTLPVFICQTSVAPDRFTAVDIVLANVVILCISIAAFCINTALSLGRAGPVQALENLKTIWQVLLTIATQGSIPNFIEIIGCVLGLLGLAVIVLSKRSAPKVSPAVNHKELTNTENTANQ